MTILPLIPLLLGLGGPPAVDTIVISDAIACDACRVRLDSVATLGEADGDGLLAGFMGQTVVKDASGAHWLFSQQLSYQLWRFDPDGSAALIGTEGQGPKEYKWIRSLGLDSHGSVVVFDRGNQRVNVLSATGSITSSMRYSGPLRNLLSVVPLSGDTVLTSAASQFGASQGAPIHAVDLSTATVVASLGTPPAVYRAQATELYQMRYLSVSRNTETVAAAHMWDYSIDLFDWPSRSLRDSYVRRARWFQPVDVLKSNPPRTRPPPVVMGVRLLDDGSVLTVLRRPRSDWRKGYVEGGVTAEGGGEVLADAMVWETVLEHIDLGRGQLLSQTVLDRLVLGFVTGAEEIAFLDDRDIIPRITIYEYTVLTSPPASDQGGAVR
jgi:hypothetical protein